VLDDEQAPVCHFDGRKVINLASNNYLGLTTHPKLREGRAGGYTQVWSRLRCGAHHCRTMKIHMELEERIARFKAWNLRCLPVRLHGQRWNRLILPRKDDYIISDELNHASIIDGCRLSRAKILVFRHKDVAHAEEQLASVANLPGKKLLISDGVFSMDGDIVRCPACATQQRNTAPS